MGDPGAGSLLAGLADPQSSHSDAIRFAQRLLVLLDEGRFTATYKFAVLLALIDLCEENAKRDGSAPTSITTAQLAERVIEIYWPQTVTYPSDHEARILRQNTSGQAGIVRLIARFRSRTVGDATAPLAWARLSEPAAWGRLVRAVEWKLIEMPLPRLQQIGNDIDEFIYRIRWTSAITAPEARSDDFDNTIRFVGRAGNHLRELAGLLRPLVKREWSAKVARINRSASGEARLDEFLFGAQRIPLDPVRQPLREYQDNRCFYCDRRIKGIAEVDHFIPWIRHPDNGIENLVAADAACNNAKRSFLAAATHLETWLERFRGRSLDELDDIAERSRWEHHPGRTLSVARSIYLQLPSNTKLWVERREFSPAEPKRLQTLLSGVVITSAPVD